MKKTSVLVMGIMLGSLSFSGLKENDENQKTTYSMVPCQWPFLAKLLDQADVEDKRNDQKGLGEEKKASVAPPMQLGGNKGLVVTAKNFKPMALHPASEKSLG